MLEIVIDARKAIIEGTLEVKRILPFRQKRMVGPFIFMDHAGPVFGGEVTHRDSLGVRQVIRPGEVNWMTAGKGISHSERFEDPEVLSSGNLEMLQTWVALPQNDEESDPEFDNYKPEELPEVTDKGIWMKLVAGNAYGLKNDVKVHSPLFYLHAEIDEDIHFGLPKEHSERAVYIADGSVEVNGRTYNKGQLLVFNQGIDPKILAKEKSTLMLLGGEPLGKRYIWWNFVSSSRERIDQAKEDWLQGRIDLPPGDDQEYVPLPQTKSKPSEGPQPGALS